MRAESEETRGKGLSRSTRRIASANASSETGILGPSFAPSAQGLRGLRLA